MSRSRTDRVFLDANVLFSAAYRDDSGLLRLWGRPGCELITSGFAREEALRNLGSDDQQARLEKLLDQVELVPEAAPRSGGETWGLPEKDVPILTAAIRAQATHLVTGDHRHFGHLMGTAIEGVLILTPSAYLSL